MGKLFVVPTPIGNLEDITLRAIRILKDVDVILAEDSRTSSVLLNHYEIKTKVISHHKFNEHKELQSLVNRLLSGENLALITDAGTPGISDPGFLLIRECIQNEIEVECLPGAVAFIPALVSSGFPCDRFFFEGFLPQKKGRQKRLNELKNYEQTLVFYESPFRLLKTLEQFSVFFGKERRISVSRELTKFYEETVRGSIEEVLQYFSQKSVKGEFVICVEGKDKHEITED